MDPSGHLDIGGGQGGARTGRPPGGPPPHWWPSHYDTVGAALLWTLEQGLGSAWTPDVKAAWSNAYALLADVMEAAAGEPTSVPDHIAKNHELTCVPAMPMATTA